MPLKTFKRLTDRKKEVTDEDLFTILTDIQTDSVDIKKYELVSFQVQYDSAKAATAVASLKTPEGEQIEAAGSGQGSVEALYNALESMIKEEIHVKTFHLNSIGQGRDALVDVNVNMTVNGTVVGGRGSAQDLIEASAKAFLNAVNRVFLKENSRKMKASL